MLFDPNDYTKKIDRLAGYHIGTIVDNNDPERRGRVRVLTSVVTTLPINMIPWASVLMTASLGGGTKSSNIIPEVNSKVLVVYPDDVYTPIVLGYLNDASTVLPEYQTNYPNRYGFKDSEGLTTIIDKQARTVQITHASGTQINIAASGAVSITSPSNITIDPNNTLTINGDIVLNGRMDATSDVTAAGISLIHHVHGGIISGGSTTAQPQ